MRQHITRSQAVLAAGALAALLMSACGASSPEVSVSGAAGSGDGAHAWAVSRCEEEGWREARLAGSEPELRRVQRTTAASLARWDRPRHGPAPDATSPWDDEPDDARIAICTYAISNPMAPGVAPPAGDEPAPRPDRAVVVVQEDDGAARLVTAYNAAHASEQSPERLGPPGEEVSRRPG